MPGLNPSFKWFSALIAAAAAAAADYLLLLVIRFFVTVAFQPLSGLRVPGPGLIYGVARASRGMSGIRPRS